MNSSKLPKSLELPFNSLINTLRFNRDGNRLLLVAKKFAAGHNYKYTTVVSELDLSSMELFWKTEFERVNTIKSAEYGENWDRVLAIDGGGGVHFLSQESGELLGETSMRLKNQSSHDASISKDKKSIVLGTTYKMGIWNLK